MDIPEKFKINLNQNLWGLVFTFVALGLAEYFQLHVLFWFAAIGSGVMLLSVIITTGAYTFRYCKNRF